MGSSPFRVVALRGGMCFNTRSEACLSSLQTNRLWLGLGDRFLLTDPNAFVDWRGSLAKTSLMQGAGDGILTVPLGMTSMRTMHCNGDS